MCILTCSLRAAFSSEDAKINPLHGSSSTEEVEKDMKFFFPVEHTLAVIKPTAMTEKGQLSACEVVLLYEEMKAVQH